MDIGYIAVETFIPPQNYLDWSKLFHVKEVISIDCALCPRVITELMDEDYKYIEQVEGDYVFTNLNWLLSRVEYIDDKQILALIREPESDCSNDNFDNRFIFYGYDLVENDTGISALLNCGGFDKVFCPSDLTQYGLICEYNKAKEVQLKLKEEYPEESHADCVIWAIWRMEVLQVLKT